jgi:hypothetical protein
MRLRWAETVRANPWLVPALGAVGVAVATITGGPIWGLFELYMLAFLGLVAWDSHRRSGARGGTPAEKQLPFQPKGQFAAEPWDQPGGLPPPAQDSGDAVAEPAKELQLRVLPEPEPLDPYPILEAFVAANRSEPDRVRTALEPWIKDAAEPARQKEREAQLHYWLFRAGLDGELDRLRALAQANPNLAEVVLYWRLAVQETGETWS